MSLGAQLWKVRVGNAQITQINPAHNTGGTIAKVALFTAGGVLGLYLIARQLDTGGTRAGTRRRGLGGDPKGGPPWWVVQQATKEGGPRIRQSSTLRQVNAWLRWCNDDSPRFRTLDRAWDAVANFDCDPKEL